MNSALHPAALADPAPEEEPAATAGGEPSMRTGALPVARAGVARRGVLSLANVDRALIVGDLFAFSASGLFTAALVVGSGYAFAPVHVVAVAVATLIFSRMLARAKVYKTPAHVVNVRLARRVLQATLFTFVALVAAAFVLDERTSQTREWLIFWLVLSLTAIFAYRLVLAAFVRQLIEKGHLQRRVAIYGGDAQGVAVIEHLGSADDQHYALVGFYDDRFHRVPEAIMGYERRGGLAELEADVENGLVDEVIVALPLAAVERLTAIMNRLSRYSVTVLFAPDLATWRFFDRPFETVGGAPMLRALEEPIHGWAGVAKFIEDRLLATVLVVALSPLLALVALAIRLDSPGPILFRQPRRGWNGGLFTIYKFRSMRTDAADIDGAAQTTRTDPRVTRVGRILRRTSIDELPQLFNVLSGDMSLVGPRPHALGTKAEGKPFDEAVADYMRRYRVKPGITGWAQVNGWRGETDTNRKLLVRVRYDIEYIENWTFWFDLYILAITPLSLIFRSDNAY